MHQQIYQNQQKLKLHYIWTCRLNAKTMNNSTHSPAKSQMISTAHCQTDLQLLAPHGAKEKWNMSLYQFEKFTNDQMFLLNW